MTSSEEHTRVVAAALIQPFKRIERTLANGSNPLTTTRAISMRMGRVRQRSTFAELLVRRCAYGLGLRYTVNNRDLPGSPDLANRSRRFAIFVHGCFWHRHRGCVRASTPKRNRTFWQNKFTQNERRDRHAIDALRRLGYEVLVIWECETTDQINLARKLASLKSKLEW